MIVAPVAEVMTRGMSQVPDAVIDSHARWPNSRLGWKTPPPLTVQRKLARQFGYFDDLHLLPERHGHRRRGVDLHRLRFSLLRLLPGEPEDDSTGIDRRISALRRALVLPCLPQAEEAVKRRGNGWRIIKELIERAESRFLASIMLRQTIADKLKYLETIAAMNDLTPEQYEDLVEELFPSKVEPWPSESS